VRTGEHFGGHHLADIVAGIATDKVMERGHQNLPTFGVGRDHDREWWLGLIRELEAGEYLVRGDGRTAGFELSQKGRLLLAGRESFSAVRPSGRTTRAAASAAAEAEAREAPTLDYGDQEDLFQCLKALRKRIAQGRGVPPYVVFSDKTLRVMARNRPLDAGALLRCQGVGDAKLAAYGTAFLQAIHVFCETGMCQ
jgi:ATP-dependent DNA helicase RecQ